MSLTLPELCDKLKELDEITLIEVLNLNSERIVELAMDVIEEDADRLENMFDDGEEE